MPNSFEFTQGLSDEDMHYLYFKDRLELKLTTEELHDLVTAATAYWKDVTHIGV